MKKKVLLTILIGYSCTVFSGTATTVADIANEIVDNLEKLPNLMSALSYIFGIVLGIKGVLKFKEHNESKGQVKLGVPIAMVVAASLFIGLPSFISAGAKTLWGNDTIKQISKF